MSTDAGLSPLRLPIESGVLALFDQRLVMICGPICNGRVDVQDLASQEHRDIAIGELRGRPTMAMAELGRRMESQGRTNEADWARAVGGAKTMASIVAGAGMR